MKIKVIIAFLLSAALTGLSAQNVGTSERFALVIGNGAYTSVTKLKNPVNDANDVAAALKALGFRVELLKDANLDDMENAVVQLGNRLTQAKNATGFFYYAGHGVQSNGVNYLIPTDANIASEAFLKTKALAAQSVLDTLQQAGGSLNVVVLDACRDNPFGWARSSNRGLTVVGTQPPSSIIAYATGAGSVAQDGTGRNGLFTTHLLKNLATPGLDVMEIFRRTGSDVMAASGNKQIPAVYNQFFGSVVLNGGTSGGVVSGTSRPADVMVRAAETGAEVWVDGVRQGKVPVLVKGLPSDRSVRVEVKAAASAGTVELTLKPGELREVTVALSPLVGNLVVASNEADVQVVLDGVTKGPLGSGVLRNLPVGVHTLELLGKDLYAAQVVRVVADTTTQVSAQVVPVGSLEVQVPADAGFVVSRNGSSGTFLGPQTVAHLPVGVYQLSTQPGSYLPMTASITIEQGKQARWVPFTTGTLDFQLTPSQGVTCFLTDKRVVDASGWVENLAPGTYQAVLKKPGYKDRTVPITVALGKVSVVNATLEAYRPGTILTKAVGFQLYAFGEGVWTAGVDDGKGTLRFADIPSGYPVPILFRDPGMGSAEGVELTVTLSEGQVLNVELPTGRFSLPWLGTGASVKVGTQTLALNTEEGLRSPELLVGTYDLEIDGTPPYSGQVTITAQGVAEVPGYRSAMTSALRSERTKQQNTLSFKKGAVAWGWTSLGIGVAGTAGAVAAYLLGSQAGTAYSQATNTTDAQAAKAQVGLYGVLLPVAAGVGGLGFAASPLLFAGANGQEALQSSLKALDQSLRTLGAQE